MHVRHLELVALLGRHEPEALQLDPGAALTPVLSRVGMGSQRPHSSSIGVALARKCNETALAFRRPLSWQGRVPAGNRRLDKLLAQVPERCFKALQLPEVHVEAGAGAVVALKGHDRRRTTVITIGVPL